MRWGSTSACIYFKKAYDSLKRKDLYDVLIAFSVPIKLVSLVKTFLIEACSEV